MTKHHLGLEYETCSDGWNVLVETFDWVILDKAQTKTFRAATEFSAELFLSMVALLGLGPPALIPTDEALQLEAELFILCLN